MSNLENKVIKGLALIGYKGPLSKTEQLRYAVDVGPKDIEYTKLTNHITNEIRTLLNIDEEVNSITSPEDSVAFIMEVTSFLKELSCPYSCLVDGLVSERLQCVSDRLLLLDYLIGELMAARILQEKKPGNKIELKIKETPEAADLRQILMTLRFSKPPANITLAQLFSKIGPTIEIIFSKVGVNLVGKPIFNGYLSEKQWEVLKGVQQDLNNEYKIRREMLLTRLDVTIQSFEWSDKTKGKEAVIENIYAAKRKLLKVEPDVSLADVIAARIDIAIIEKTSNSSVRKNTQTQLNKVIIGQVPDRGGRTSEQAPPPPEMPFWQERKGGPAGGPRGGGNQYRGGGNQNRGGGRNFNQAGNRDDGNQQSRGYNSNYNQQQNYGQQQSFDSAGSYSYDNSHNKGGGYNSGGGYNTSRDGYTNAAENFRGNNHRRDSGGNRNDYEQTNKRAKTYDSFQANKTTYADQYVQESQQNQQYHGRGRGRGGRGGRNNSYRGGGNNYRNNY